MQFVHWVALVYPDPIPNVPATQAIHAEVLTAPMLDDAVPGLHRVQLLAEKAPSRPEKVPAEQFEHWVELVNPVPIP